MPRSNRELWLAFIAILIITLIYGLFLLLGRDIPRASDLFGHGLGILGFALMLMTETLYSYRKRSRRIGWGSMARWLEFHIFTGLVGPYMVLLHTSWKFNGLAGIAMLLTVIIVISGFIGRYIYTSVPRTVHGAALEAGEIQAQIQAIEMELARVQEAGVMREPGERSAVSGEVETQPSRRVLAGSVNLLQEWRNSPDRSVSHAMESMRREHTRRLRQLQRRKQTLQRQVGSLVMARRLLSVWHTVHVPIGLALFTSAILHIAAAIYYATLLR